MKHFMGKWMIVLLISGFVTLNPGIKGSCVALYPLDQETVFSLYHRLSGDYIDDQDLEELARLLGRPLFTAFKPTEMFTKAGLNGLRAKFERQIKKFGKDSIFTWEIDTITGPEQPLRIGTTGILGHGQMPQATPLIRAEISKAGLKSIRNIMKGINSEFKSATPIKLILYLIPRRAHLDLDQRSVALEDIFLPLRRVVFHPIKMEIEIKGNRTREPLVYSIAQPPNT